MPVQERILWHAHAAITQWAVAGGLLGNPVYIFLQDYPAPTVAALYGKHANWVKTTRVFSVFGMRDFHTLPDDDPMTFALFQRGKTDGICQLESSGSQEHLRELMPDRVEELAAIVAIYRPGPTEADMLREFVDRKHGQLKWSHPSPEVEEILDETRGVLLYWEQIAEILHRVAGLDLRDGGELLKALCKRSQDNISQIRERFRSGARQRHVEPQVADAIFEEIESRGPHTFCKAHAMNYAYLAYQMVFLKAHYPEEFEAAMTRLESVASA